MSKLLPQNSSKIEHAAEDIAISSFAQLDKDFKVIDTHPLSCPQELLPILAMAWKVKIDGLPIPHQRTAIANALKTHRHIGTIHAVKQLCQNAGFGEVIVIDNFNNVRYGSYFTYGAVHYSMGVTNWFDFKIIVKNAISEFSARLLRLMINAIKPARSRLVAVLFDKGVTLYGKQLHYGSLNKYGGVIRFQKI